MVAVPFIYFSFLLFLILKKKRTYDISAYLVTLYAVSSFFSIVIDLNNLRSFETMDYKIDFIPTIVYCLLLTLTILPFYFFKSQEIKSITLRKPRLFDFIVYIYFFCFLLVTILSFSVIIKILNGDLSALRVQVGEGPIEVLQLPGPVKIIFLVANILGDYSLIMLLFYFYSLCFLKRSKTFNTIILVSSLTIIVIAILGVDRSKVIYWLICYGFMIVLFRRFMKKKQRRQVIISSIIILTGVIIYFLSLTFSRFDASDMGSQGSLISYTGQSFINFTFFYDEVHYKNLSLQRIFPLVYKLFINNGIEKTGDLDADIFIKTGHVAAVFSTFIGNIMISSGKLITALYCIFFFFISQVLLKLRSYKTMDFHKLIILFCLITIPMLGIFAHFYNGFTRTIDFIVFMLIAFHMRFYNGRKTV